MFAMLVGLALRRCLRWAAPRPATSSALVSPIPGCSGKAVAKMPMSMCLLPPKGSQQTASACRSFGVAAGFRGDAAEASQVDPRNTSCGSAARGARIETFEVSKTGDDLAFHVVDLVQQNRCVDLTSPYQ